MKGVIEKIVPQRCVYDNGWTNLTCWLDHACDVIMYLSFNLNYFVLFCWVWFSFVLSLFVSNFIDRLTRFSLVVVSFWYSYIWWYANAITSTRGPSCTHARTGKTCNLAFYPRSNCEYLENETEDIVCFEHTWHHRMEWTKKFWN